LQIKDNTALQTVASRSVVYT